MFICYRACSWVSKKSTSDSLRFSGLTSILFAINIDNEDLNTIRRAQGLDLQFNPIVEGLAAEVDREKPVFAADSSGELSQIQAHN